MPALEKMADNVFDLAICDPLYGVQESAYRNNDKSKLAKTTKYHDSLWSQKKTTPVEIKEILRVSKNQIIWGGNYFISSLYDTRCMIVWDKDNTGNFADAELAWTSFDECVRIFKFRWNGMLQQNMKEKENRIHPTQKPVELYKWLLQNYAKEGDKILDTHLGSGSIALACWDIKFDLTGYEIDKEYFDNAVLRLERHKAQGQLF